MRIIHKEYSEGKGQDMESDDGSLSIKTEVLGVEPKSTRTEVLSNPKDKILLKHKENIKQKENKQWQSLQTS